MGSIDNGFLGGFTGRFGNVVGYRWRGIMCVRSLPTQYRDARTPEQLQQRTLFKQVVCLASRARRVLKVGFKCVSLDAGMTESNYFMRINKRCFSVVADGSSGDTPSYHRALSVDYERLVLADGPVAPVDFDEVRLLDETTLSVDFVKNPQHRVANPDDLVYVAAYCPELGDFDLSTPVYRRSKSLTMSLNEYWIDREVQLWGFVVDGAGRASRSQYLGSVLLSDVSLSAEASDDGPDVLCPFDNNSFSAYYGDAADAADDHLRGSFGGVVGLPDIGALGADVPFGGAVP